MDSKILYTNDNADIQCVAVKSIETVRNTPASSKAGRAPSSGGTVQRKPLSSSDDVVFLLPHESLYSYLYIGAADGTLIALRFQVFLKELTVPGGGQTYEHRVALEAQSKAVITVATPSAAASPRGSKMRPRKGEAQGDSPGVSAAVSVAAATAAGVEAHASAAAAVGGVRCIDAPTALPYVFLLVHGRFEVHEDDTLQALERDYTASLGLKGASVLFMCVGHEQDAASRRRRPFVPPGPRSTAAAGDADGNSTAAATAAAACAASQDFSAPAVFYALLLDSSTVVLVECTKTAARRLAFVNGSAEAIGWSQDDLDAAPHSSASTSASHAAHTTLTVQPNTSTMAWCRDVLIAGSPEYYCLYDTLHGTVLSQLEVGALLGGCPPYTAFIRGAGVDPARSGFELAAESAEVCSYSTGSADRSSSSSSSFTDSDSSGSDRATETSSSSGSSSTRSAAAKRQTDRALPGTAAGWPSALVFRLRDGQLHVCAGAGLTDLTAAAPLADAFGAVEEVHSCPPFLLCQRGGHEGKGDAQHSVSGGGGGGSQSPSSRIKASFQELRRASQQLSAKLTEARRPARQCELTPFSCLDGRAWTSPEVEPTSFMSVNLRGVQTFPLGLLGVSRHMVEALLWKPFAVQLEDQIESGHYARVLRFVSQCFRGSESARRVVLRRVCQASATRAMSRRRYRVAFYFYTIAETGVDSLLRLFPELQRPSPPPPPQPTLSSTQLGSRRSTKEGSNFFAGDKAGLGASASFLRGRSAERDSEEVVEAAPPRHFSYTSHAPYRALYRILLSQFLALVSAAGAEGEASTTPPTKAEETDFVARNRESGEETVAGGEEADLITGAADGRDGTTSNANATSTSPSSAPASLSADASRIQGTPTPAFAPGSQLSSPQLRGTPTPSFPGSPLSGDSSPLVSPATEQRTRANIEFALFCLFAIDCAGARHLRSTRDELLQFMVAVRTLDADDCAVVLTSLGIPPQSLLTTMLLATTGDYHAALAQCEDDADVSAAGAVLAMYARTPDATAAELERLYQLHLPWMLRVDPVATVQLLTTPARFAGEKPGPAALLPILLTIGGTVLLDYLSYLINTACSTEPVVHQLYATHLIQTLQTLREEWGLQGFASAELGAEDGAGSETGLVGHVRRALLSFLQCSPYYDRERVLAALVQANLHEEQCVVLEALEDHIGVLTVLVYAMKDLNRAVRYCEAHYARDRSQAHRWLPLAELLHRSDTQRSAEVPSSPLHPSSDAADSSAASSPRRSGERGGELHVPSLLANSAMFPDAAGPSSAAAKEVSGASVWMSTKTASGGAGRSEHAEAQAGAVALPLFPSRDCLRAATREAAAMSLYTHAFLSEEQPTQSHIETSSGSGSGAEEGPAGTVAPSRVPAWHPVMRFNQYLHMLLHVLLVPPQGSAVALPEIVWLLSTHSPFMSPRLVLSSLPGDVPLSHIAPYLIRAFQRLELNHQLVRIEAAAVQSALADAVRWHISLQQRCVWMGEQRRCVVCGEVLGEGGLVVVFPNLKPAHFRCHRDSTLDPERAVPFVSNTA